jgi:hypothetical protein
VTLLLFFYDKYVYFQSDDREIHNPVLGSLLMGIEKVALASRQSHQYRGAGCAFT